MMSDEEASVFSCDGVESEESEESDFEMEVENVPPKKKTAASRAKKAAPKKAAPKKAATTKKAAATKKGRGKKVLSDMTNKEDEDESIKSMDDFVESSEDESKPKKTVEQIYQKKSQLEHILLRPDTYVGSVVQITQTMFVLSADTDRITQRDVTFTPGLFKIFDEIVVNAADNKQRDPKMDKLDISIDKEGNTISVENNGKTIPVVMHKEHQCYVPTLIFGHLLTGSNFDDEEKKTTGGRNGYGAKLANIFSKEFTVECIDVKNKLHFHQVFRDNMSIAETPTVKPIKAAAMIKAGDKTKISFKPDLQRFGMSELDEDTVGLLSKRAYDMAAVLNNAKGKKLSVSLNGKKLMVKNFRDYVKLYDGINAPVAFEKVGDRWEVGIGLSEGSFQQVSFVNSICTSKGGQHTTFIAEKVAARLATTLKKKNKTEIKSNQIKNHLCVFVNCLIENPAFDSQTKEFLTTRPKDFGSTCELSEKFLKQVEKSDITESIMNYVKFKQGEALKRKGGAKRKKLTGIAKLDDANFAGSPKSKDCTLIITEGDSAKSLAMSGLSVVGRDYYGVFPLKGKPLNVRDATHKAIMGNEEIKNLVDIMGLKFGFQYDESTIKNLRYGHLMIMADQDSDGSHIKGLVINFVHHFWPSLLDVPGFLQQFITPIVKATKGKKSTSFYTLPEYDAWRESTNGGKGFTIKYYKGLGTSTNKEAKEYFSNLDHHEIHFSELSADVHQIEDDSDSEDNEMAKALPDKKKATSGSDLIKMAFSKHRVEDRKSWLNKFEKGTFLDYSAAQRRGVHYSDFVNKEFILFSRADNVRSIPHIMDGFKPSQRKVLFSCFKRKLKSEVKVAQLAGYIGEHSAYHHGEASLAGTIINMAQSFCGSNNINLLTPGGQFGTRRMGGKDHASPRYIFTNLEPVTRTIFHPDDDALLTYLNDDGLSIEPEYYMPVIPMVLVNGAEGIGTGWSSSIPNYDPRVIIQNIRRIINDEPMETMTPFYSGFTGEITAETGKRTGSYAVKGKIERVDETTLHISELQLKKWTQDYKVFLEGMLTGEDKKESVIKDFKENHTDDTVSFTVIATKEKIDEFEKEKNGLYGKFKLTTSLSTSNMNLFNQQGHIQKFESPEKILETFYALRLDFYCRRKALLLENLQREKLMLSNKARFVEEVCKGDLVVSNRKRTELLTELKNREYDLFNKQQKRTQNDDDEESESEEEEEATDAELAKGYEYLLGMKIWSLTYEKVLKLREELGEKMRAVDELERTAPSDIWLRDLDEIETALDNREEQIMIARDEERKAQAKSKKRNQKKKKALSKRKKNKDEWDSDESSSGSDDSVFEASAPVARSRATKPRKKKSPPVKSIEIDSNVMEVDEKDREPSPSSESQSSKESEVVELVDSPREAEIASLAERVQVGMYVSPAKPKGPPTEEESASGSTGSRRRPLSPKKPASKANKRTRKVAPKKAAPKKKNQGRRKKASEDSDSENTFDFDDEAPVEAAPRTKRATRGRKAVSYTVDLVDTDEDKVVDSDSDASL